MINFFPNEEFKELILPHKRKKNYALSNYGRVVSYTDNFENGTILKLGKNKRGYRILYYQLYNKPGKIKHINLYVYNLVAELFIPKTSKDQKHVIHINHIYDQDHISNLKWVTTMEMHLHREKSPLVKKYRATTYTERTNGNGRKLTSTQVMFIKKKLLDANYRTKIKILAKQFGVSESHLYRIKRGKNWSEIKV